MTGEPDYTREHAARSGLAAPLFVLPVFKNAIRSVATDFFNAMLDLVLDLFNTVLRELLFLDPAHLQELEPIYQLSMIAYISLLGIFGLVSLGLFQTFPGDEKMDPLRFGKRAFAATLSLFIVNPPGWGSNLFVQGAFAWAFEVTNALTRVYLLEFVNIEFSSNLADAVGGPFLLFAYAVTMFGPILIVEVLLFAGLALRQVMVFVVYGIYPLLIVFWVADMGPLKHGKELSMKLFKTSVTLMAGGILIGAVFAVGFGLIANTSQLFAAGAGGGGAADATFQSSEQYDALFTVALKGMLMIVMCVLPLLMIKQMLGAVGAAAASALTETLNAVTSVAAAIATGGAGGLAVSGATAAAKQAGKQAAKKGAKTAVKQVAKKGVGGAAKQAGKRAAGAAKNAGTRAVKKAPGAAKKAGKKAASEGRVQVERGTQDALSGTAGGVPEDEEEPAPGGQRGGKGGGGGSGNRSGSGTTSQSSAPRPTSVSVKGGAGDASGSDSGSNWSSGGGSGGSSGGQGSSGPTNPSLGEYRSKQ